MAISFVQAAVSGDLGAGTEQTIGLNGVVAGNLIVCVGTWEGSSTVTGSVSDGTSNFVAGTRGSGLYVEEPVIHAQPFYLLSANGGNKTFTLTLSGAMGTLALHALEFSADGEWSFEGQSDYGSGDGASVSTGVLTTSGIDVISVAFVKPWGYRSISAWAIVESAATETTDAVGSAIGYGGGTAYLAGSLTSDSAEATLSAADDSWVAGLIAFAAAESTPEAPTINAYQSGSNIIVAWS